MAKFKNGQQKGNQSHGWVTIPKHPLNHNPLSSNEQSSQISSNEQSSQMSSIKQSSQLRTWLEEKDGRLLQHISETLNSFLPVLVRFCPEKLNLGATKSKDVEFEGYWVKTNITWPKSSKLKFFRWDIDIVFRNPIRGDTIHPDNIRPYDERKWTKSNISNFVTLMHCLTDVDQVCVNNYGKGFFRWSYVQFQTQTGKFVSLTNFLVNALQKTKNFDKLLQYLDSLNCKKHVPQTVTLHPSVPHNIEYFEPSFESPRKRKKTKHIDEEGQHVMDLLNATFNISQNEQSVRGVELQWNDIGKDCNDQNEQLLIGENDVVNNTYVDMDSLICHETSNFFPLMMEPVKFPLCNVRQMCQLCLEVKPYHMEAMCRVHNRRFICQSCCDARYWKYQNEQVTNHCFVTWVCNELCDCPMTQNRSLCIH